MMKYTRHNCDYCQAEQINKPKIIFPVNEPNIHLGENENLSQFVIWLFLGYYRDIFKEEGDNLMTLGDVW